MTTFVDWKGDIWLQSPYLVSEGLNTTEYMGEYNKITLTFSQQKLKLKWFTSSSLFSLSGFLSLMSVGSELSSSRSRLYSVDLTGELSHLRRLLGNQINQLELEVKTSIPSKAQKTRES